MKLFSEFPPVSNEEWRAAIERDLKGADFEKRLVTVTEDGLRIPPYARRGDRPPLGPLRRTAGWATREIVRETASEGARELVLRAVEGGADEIALQRVPSEGVWNFEALLGERSPAGIAFVFDGGAASPALLRAWVDFASRRGIAPSALRGGAGYDPVASVLAGETDAELAEAAEEVSSLDWAREVGYGGRPFAIEARLVAEAGGSPAQEVLYAALRTAEILALRPDALPRIEMRFGAGTSYFLEIAKFRAARLVLGRIARTYGARAEDLFLQACTLEGMLTLYDAPTNLLRGTTAAMAAVLGGADSVAVQPFDARVQPPNPFSNRLARNTSLLLRLEAYLDRVADPLAGSYSLDALTGSMADVVWQRFCALVGLGSFAAIWAEGSFASEIARVRAAKEKAIAGRRTPIVGTSSSPDPEEKIAARRVPERPRRAWRLGTLEPVEPKESLLTPFRPSEPFERLRLRTEAHPEPVTVLLAQTGDPVMRRARAQFCLGFFGSAGFRSVERIVEPERVGEAARAERAAIVALCAADSDYPEAAPAAARSLREANATALLVVAGYPEPEIERLREAGVQEFVHIRANAIELLERFQERLGIA